MIFSEQAAKAVDENTFLRSRVAQLSYEEELRQHAANSQPAPPDTTAVDKLRTRNNALQDEISTLSQELADLKQVNVTELYHEYRRLDKRRALLLKENAGLRSILANQHKGVQRATDAVNAHNEMRRANEEQNATSKADMQMMRERREKMQAETAYYTRREAQLKSELKHLPSAGENYESRIAHLLDENSRKRTLLQQLEKEAAVAESGAQQAVSSGEQERTHAAEVERLRGVYVNLKEELRRQRAG